MFFNLVIINSHYRQSNANEAIKIKREYEIGKMESVEVGLINKLQKS